MIEEDVKELLKGVQIGSQAPFNPIVQLSSDVNINVTINYESLSILSQ